MIGEIKNARIRNTFIGKEHGCLTAMVLLEYKDSGQSFGGYQFNGDRGFGIRFIESVISVVGVNSWEELPGALCRVLATESKIIGIGNILEDRWFYPDELAKAYQK